MYWEKDIETMDRDKLEALQLSRLKETLEKAGKSPYYTKIFKETCLYVDQINSLQDVEKLSLTTKDDLRQ